MTKFQELIRQYSVLLCVVVSVFFLVIATLLYPGGSILDKNSVGFHWSKNFFSNLFLVKALNGAANPSRIWALIGMAFNAVGYGLFFIHASRKITQKLTARVLKYIGVVNMVFTFLIATSLHDIMVTVSTTLTMIGLFYITVFIVKTKLRWLQVFCIVSLILFYATLLLYGAGHWGMLAVMQKVTFLCFMLLVLAIEYLTDGRDFQQNAQRQPAAIATNR